LFAVLREGVRDAEENGSLSELSGLDGAAAQMVRDTGPELVDALVRVREAAAGGEPCPRGDRRGDS
jgi:hypothetical protein